MQGPRSRVVRYPCQVARASLPPQATVSSFLFQRPSAMGACWRVLQRDTLARWCRIPPFTKPGSWDAVSGAYALAHGVHWYLCMSESSTQYALLNAVLAFIRSHGCHALAINGAVQFECADGIRHTVRTMPEAREVLGY